MTMMLLEWVFTSIFLILVVLALRAALGKRMSAGLRYALWAVVLVRLLVPVQLFTSPIAGTWVFTEARTEKQIDAPAGAVPSYSPGGDDVSPALGKQDGPTVVLNTFPGAPDAPAVPDAPEPPAAPDLTRAPAWLGWMWLAGSAAVALVLLASNLRFYRRLRGCRVPLDGADRPLRVYVAVGLPSPCLFGIFRPAVYVTPEAAADPDMLRHVLAHEYTHYRHGDHLWSLLRCAALAVHWWNPLVWLAAGLSQRDGELACDEGALKRLGDGERAAYGGTLLTLVTAKPGPGDLFRCATTMAGDKKSLKERITLIAQAPKRWLWAAAVAVLVTALACVCAFGQAEPEDPEADFWPDGVSEMTFIRDKGGFGGDFNIHLDKDGDFTYYAGLFSSYIGMGTWTREGDVICLADEGLKGSAGIQYFYFKIEDGGLVFQAENSAQFMYVDVADGDRFSLSGEDGFAPTYVMDGDRGDVVVIEGLSGYVEWSRGTNGGAFYFAGDLSCFCPKLAGEAAEGGAYWDDVKKSVLNVRFNVDDERIEDGTVGGFGIDFTVDLSSDTVTRREFTSMLGEKFIELTDQEMLDMAHILDKLMTEAEDYYNSQASEGIEVEIDFPYAGNGLSDFVVPDGVLETARDFVARQFRERAPGGVMIPGRGEYNEETGRWDRVEEPEHAAQFDRARINRMEGPWRETRKGVEIETWRINYEYHTTTPEMAEYLLVGGMYLTEDGWLCPTYPNCTYLFFEVEGEERHILTAIVENTSGPGGFAEDKDHFYSVVDDILTERSGAGLPVLVETDVKGVPEDVLDAATADVAQKFEAFAPGGWLSSWGLSFNHETNKWEPVPLPKRIGFDGVRINKMQGPWTGTLWGNTEVEVWRINYEYHAITPEFAENILTGGMYLTEDGWLCPTYPNCTYLIFLLDENGGRSFATSIMYNMGGPSETEGESAGFFGYFYPYVAQVLAGQRLVEPSGLAPDLNRNGVPEELRVSTFDGGMGRRLEVWENGRLLYEDEGYSAHAGWNAVFLYHDDDGDCLLTYNPTMYHGSAGYSYRLFTLNESGASTARYETLDFDINFQPWLHEKFDVNEIVDFMNKVNGLLSRSVQLINTDPELLDTFDRLGRLEDDLGWLNGWEPVYVRGDRTLPDELWAFKAAMESQWTDPWGLTVTAGAPTSTGLILNFIQGGQVDGELYGVPTGELMYGSRYWLERADGSGWSEVPLLDTVEILAWPLEAYPIPKDGRRSEEVDWSQVYGELAPGRYRIGKIVFDHQAPGDNDERTYYAEFEVR